jgi:AcrR family transcriptional regulator
VSAGADSPAGRRAIDALTGLVEDHGYEGTTVPEILAAAGLSEPEFAAVFGGKRACFLAAQQELADRLFEEVHERITRPGRFPERARAALRTLTSQLAARPALTRAATVELLGLGPEGQLRYQASVERYAELVEDARELSEHGSELPESTSLMAVGGVASLVFDEILADRVANLESRVPELLFTLLLPFLGAEAAAEEMRVSEHPSSAPR